MMHDSLPYKRLPLFPLNILPLPGELTPLHIFEPRYRQLLFDAEAKDISFGVYCNHPTNTKKIGAVVKLESVIKRYKSGESDIIVKCLDLFTLMAEYKTFRDKPYPGGDISTWDIDLTKPVNPELLMLFVEYMGMLKMYHHPASCSVCHIANELNFDLREKFRFLDTPSEKQEQFLFNNLQFQKKIFNAVENSKDVFHLN